MASRRFALGSVALAALVVLAGCSAAFGDDESLIEPPTDHAEGDPGRDKLGWEGGYWYDDPVAVNASDGYNESERAALVNRTMARVEQIRQLEFEESVPVDVISREQYRANRSGGGGSATFQAWNDQVWEGLFIVPESTGSSESFDQTLGESVLGYYSPGEDAIVIVSDSPTPQISNATLAHELVHALQDQHFDFPAPDTQDRQLAADSVVEGEANVVESVYTDRCGDVWSCLPRPESGSGGSGGGSVNRGLLLTILTPYTAGQAFVESVYDDRGWTGVSDLHEDEPASTEQVIHPDRYPDERPVNVTVTDRSSGEWDRYDHDPVADTVGEASIYAMFLDNGVISTEDVYSYESDPSEGWAGDALVPYTDGNETDGEGAYVWQTRWDTTEDAREFRRAYRDLLREHDARSEGSNVYVVPEDDPYGDAFRVVRDGRTVRVVNAPTVADLDAVHDAG
jgi:hypothetical protein